MKSDGYPPLETDDPQARKEIIPAYTPFRKFCELPAIGLDAFDISHSTIPIATLGDEQVKFLEIVAGFRCEDYFMHRFRNLSGGRREDLGYH